MFVAFNGTRFVEREGPLARCPKARCRRSGRCNPEPPGHPCHRLYETHDALKRQLIRKLEKLKRDHPYVGPPLSDVEVDRKLAIFKQHLMERELEHFAEKRRKARIEAEAEAAAQAGAGRKPRRRRAAPSPARPR